MNVLEKISKQYRKYDFISATKNIIYHILTRERKKSFGSLNPDKIFYVIRSIDFDSRFYIGPINNLLANYFYVLTHLKYAEKNGWIPVVDQLNYPVYNSVNFPINESMNAWEYFWEQPSLYNLEEVYSSQNVILSKQNWFNEYDIGYSVEDHQNKNKIRGLNKVSKKIPLKKQTNEKINVLINGTFPDNKKILGVNFRFGGHSKKHYGCKAGHPVQPDVEELANIVMEKCEIWNMDYIFLASDTLEAVNVFRKIFKNKLIYLKRSRYSENIQKGEKNILYLKDNIYNTSLEYLAEMLLLSKCDGLIGSISSGFRYALINNNNKYEHIEILDYGLY